MSAKPRQITDAYNVNVQRYNKWVRDHGAADGWQRVKGVSDLPIMVIESAFWNAKRKAADQASEDDEDYDNFNWTAISSQCR